MFTAFHYISILSLPFFCYHNRLGPPRLKHALTSVSWCQHTDFKLLTPESPTSLNLKRCIRNLSRWNEGQLTYEWNDVEWTVQVVVLVDTRVTVDTDGPIDYSEPLKLLLMHGVFFPMIKSHWLQSGSATWQFSGATLNKVIQLTFIRFSNFRPFNWIVWMGFSNFLFLDTQNSIVYKS